MYHPAAWSHQAVAIWRAEREPRRLLRGAALSLLVTAIAAALAWLVSRARRRLLAVLERRVRPRIEALPLESLHAVRGPQVWELVAGAVRGAFWIATLVLAYLWLEFVLIQFPWTRALGTRLMARRHRDRIRGLLTAVAVPDRA
jgi:hypothetical protein